MERRCGIFFAVVLAVAVCFAPASCALFGDDESGVEESVAESAGALTASVSGSVSVSGAVPGALRSSAARTALPSLGEEISYSVEAASGGVRPYVAEVDGDNLTFSFGDLAVVEGGTEYTITAAGKIGDETVLFGEVKKTLKPGDAFFCEVPVKPYMESGKGNVNLEISVGGTEIRSCAIELDGGSVSSYPVDSDGKILFEKTLDSGCYDAVFSFYSTADSSSADGVLLYEFRESLHVCKSLVTDSWFGSSAYITDGECVITKALVEKFALSRIYVSSRKEDSKETGTRAEPYKSVARAMNALLDKDTDYTILVDGELAGAQEIPASLKKDGSGAYKAKTLSIKGAGAGAKIDGNKEGTALTIETDVPVTIENITITGGETAGNGGGIYLASASSVTISENTEIISNDAKDGGGIFNAGTLYLCGGVISKNTASNCGGGVYSTGTMFMYGSAVIGDKSKTTAATKDESCYSNKATVKGGGICSTGDLYLGFSSADTEAVLTGGVYYNYAKNSGGIHQQDTSHSNKVFKFSSGSVSYNAERGMYVGYGKFTMTGGTVSGNTALQPEEENEDSFRGAGIYLGADCTAVISDGTISSNEAAVKGGGIHIAQSSSKLTIEGGTISGNTAGSYGSGISMDDGSLKMQGGAKIDSSNDVYLPSGKVITITGELTGEAPIATITPAAWKRGMVVLSASSAELIENNVGSFAMSDEGFVIKPKAGDSSKGIVSAPIFVASAGTDPSRKICAASDGFAGNATGSKTKPFASIKDALSVVDSDNTVITIDGNVLGNQAVLSTTIASSVTSITIAGYKEIGENGSAAKLNGNNSGTTLSVNKSGLEVTIADITITGGNFTYGGGLAIDNGTVKLTDGARITGNSASVQGGGIYIAQSASLSIVGSAQIDGNTSPEGGAVYAKGDFGISGSAYIPKGNSNSNDVCLCEDKSINITESLSAHNESNPIMITLEDYTIGAIILKASDGSSVNLAEEKNNFAIKQPLDGTSLFYISDEGKLATFTPVFSFDNGEEDGVKTNSEDNIVYDVVKYSYVNYDNLKASAVNPYEAGGFAIDFRVDGTSGALTAQNVDDGYHTLTIRVSKTGYTTLNISRRVYVMIKPVKVQISEQLHGHYRIADEPSPCPDQTFYLQAENPDNEYSDEKSFYLIYHDDNGFNSRKHEREYKWWTPIEKNYVWLTSKTSVFYFWANKSHDYVKGYDMGKINKGCNETTRTLEDLKSNRSFDSQFRDGDGNWNDSAWNRSRIWITVSLNDSEEP